MFILGVIAFQRRLGTLEWARALREEREKMTQKDILRMQGFGSDVCRCD